MGATKQPNARIEQMWVEEARRVALRSTDCSAFAACPVDADKYRTHVGADMVA